MRSFGRVVRIGRRVVASHEFGQRRRRRRRRGGHRLAYCCRRLCAPGEQRRPGDQRKCFHVAVPFETGRLSAGRDQWEGTGLSLEPHRQQRRGDEGGGIRMKARTASMLCLEPHAEQASIPGTPYANSRAVRFAGSYDGFRSVLQHISVEHRSTGLLISMLASATLPSEHAFARLRADASPLAKPDHLRVAQAAGCSIPA
jgi:hypothetical protein